MRLVIKGDVQGVFYRATAKKIADKLNLAGWIKNITGGDVEAMVTGNEDKLQEFISWCRKGPEKATVEDVIVTQEKETPFAAFEVIRGK